MNRIALNREFLIRHLFVCLLMAGMGGWFGYDGFVTYPRTSGEALYQSIEGSPAPEGMDVEAFKRQKIQTQYGLMTVCLVASAVIALHLLSVSLMRFEFDNASFVWKGRRYQFGDVKSVDLGRWDKKGILVLKLDDGAITLDSWHHTGVKEFKAMLLPTRMA